MLLLLLLVDPDKKEVRSLRVIEVAEDKGYLRGYMFTMGFPLAKGRKKGKRRRNKGDAGGLFFDKIACRRGRSTRQSRGG